MEIKIAQKYKELVNTVESSDYSWVLPLLEDKFQNPQGLSHEDVLKQFFIEISTEHQDKLNIGATVHRTDLLGRDEYYGNKISFVEFHEVFVTKDSSMNKRNKFKDSLDHVFDFQDIYKLYCSIDLSPKMFELIKKQNFSILEFINYVLFAGWITSQYKFAVAAFENPTNNKTETSFNLAHSLGLYYFSKKAFLEAKKFFKDNGVIEQKYYVRGDKKFKSLPGQAERFDLVDKYKFSRKYKFSNHNSISDVFVNRVLSHSRFKVAGLESYVPNDVGFLYTVLKRLYKEKFAGIEQLAIDEVAKDYRSKTFNNYHRRHALNRIRVRKTEELENSIYESIYSFCSLVYSNDYMITKSCDFGNRKHNLITRLSKHLRNSLTYADEELVEMDLKNAQWQIVMDQAYNACKTGKVDYDSSKLNSEYDLWKKIYNKDFYKDIAATMGITRDEAKKLSISFLFDLINKTCGSWNDKNKIYLYISKRFGFLKRYMWHLFKFRSKHQLCKDAQRAESRLITDLLKRYCKDADVKFTVHDAIFTNKTFMNTPRDFRISQIYYMKRKNIVDKADIGKIVHKTPKEMIEYHLSLLGFRYSLKKH